MARLAHWAAGLWRALVLAAACLAATAACATEPPAESTARIVAVGDLHGDFVAWRAIARDARLVDGQGRWSGGRTVLVQTGDVVDRGPDSLKIVQDLIRLQGEARRAGGRIYALVGNHEAMNVTDDLRYVSAGDYAAFVTPESSRVRDAAYEAARAEIEADYRARDPKLTDAAIRQAWMTATPLGAIEHQAAWRPEGPIGRWVTGNPAVLVLDGTVFVHGGVSAAYAGQPVAEINRRVAAALAAHETAPNSILTDPQGPLWYRGLATGDGPSVDRELDQVLPAMRARRMVIGHTPILTGIEVSHGGRLVRIDTGISAVFGGKLTWLEIVGDALTPHTVERPAGSGGSGGGGVR